MIPNSFRCILLATALGLMASSCSQQGDHSPNHLIPQNEINHLVFDRYFQNLKGFSGNVLVAVNGIPIFQRSYGYANLEFRIKNTLKTKFRIGSITKPFTATAILLLEQQGRLNFDDKISKHLNNLPSHLDEITIHQLVTHTSGLMHSWDMEGFADEMMLHLTEDQVWEKYTKASTITSPGEEFHYSGIGYFLLSAIIGSVSGKPYEDYVGSEVFEKIGMMHSGSDRPEQVISHRAQGYQSDKNATYMYMPILMGAGNLYSTVGDILKWDQSLYDNSLLNKASTERMFRIEKRNYSYGWEMTVSDSLNIASNIGGVPGFLARVESIPQREDTGSHIF